MTTGVAGNKSFNRDVHSMPDIPGRRMSIKIASGLTSGIIRTASSADGQVQTQSNPPNDWIICTQLRHKSSWSSTSATLTVAGTMVFSNMFAKGVFMRYRGSGTIVLDVSTGDSPTGLGCELSASDWRGEFPAASPGLIHRSHGLKSEADFS